MSVSPHFQILIHIGNCCIHACLDYTALLREVVFLGGSRAQGIMGGRERAGRFFLFLLNEILFAGGTQLGNIRTCRLVRARVHTCKKTGARI